MSGERGIFFFGSVVRPDVAERDPFCAPWMNKNQLNYIEGLLGKGYTSATCFGALPYATFPKGDRLYIRGEKAVQDEKISIINPSYLNVPLIKQVGLAISIYKAVGRELRKGTPSIFLSFNARPFYAGAGMMRAKKKGIPMFVIVADFENRRQVKFFKHPLRFVEAWLSEKIIKKSEGLICYSRYVARDLSYGKNWIKIEGAISEETKTKYLDETIRENGKNILVFSGSLYKWGGIGLLLDAFSSIDNPDYELWITGRGTMEQAVMNAAENDERIKYFGYISSTELGSLLSRATILINPRPSYLKENRYNFPGKLLDYLASGRPVITTATGDVLEDYGDMAFVLKEETPEGLAELIQEVCNMQEDILLEKSKKNREYMMKHKTWNAQTEKLYKYIEDACSTQGV